MAARLAIAIDADAQGIQRLLYRVGGVNNLDTVDLAADFSVVRYCVATVITSGKTTFFIPVTIAGTTITFNSATLAADLLVLDVGGRPR